MFPVFTGFWSWHYENVGKGFNKKFWRPRTQHEHRQDVAEVLALEPRRRPAKEKERGVRYSPLLDLEYYHPIQFCAIDAMHNLFLGTAKTFMRLLLQHKDKRTREDLLNDDKMAIIDQRLSEFKQGLTDEWVVENMKSNMGTLTAAEWRHWTLVSSAYCLHGLIPAQYLNVWEHFVRGADSCLQHAYVMMCWILLTPTLRNSEMDFRTLWKCRSYPKHAYANAFDVSC